MRIETITDIGSFERVRGDWERLRVENENELPFYLFDWLLVWWKHYRADHKNVRDSLRIKVVRGDDGAVVAVAPFMVTQRRSFGFVSTGTYQFLGTDSRITEIRGPLATPACAEAAGRALVDDLRTERGWEWVRWCGLTPGSPLARAIESKGPFVWTLIEPDYVLPLPPSFEELKKGLKRNIRESLRKCYNSLKRDGHSMALEVAETPEAVAAALPDFVRLHAMRANVQDGVVHLDRFAKPVPRAFIDELTMVLAQQGVCKIFTLKVAGQPVASRMGFVVGRSLYLYYSGYDTAWGKYSVMTTTVAEALRWSIERGLKSANLSIGTDVSKTRWGAVEIPYLSGIQLEGGLRSRAIYESSRVVYKARKNPKLWELANRAPMVKKVVGKLLARRA